MATLDNSSGKFRGSKAPKHVNARARAAMMTAINHHHKRVPQSQRYYEKSAPKARDTTRPSAPSAVMDLNIAETSLPPIARRPAATLPQMYMADDLR